MFSPRKHYWDKSFQEYLRFLAEKLKSLQPFTDIMVNLYHEFVYTYCYRYFCLLKFFSLPCCILLLDFLSAFFSKIAHLSTESTASVFRTPEKSTTEFFYEKKLTTIF